MAHGMIQFVQRIDVGLIGGTGIGTRLAALGGTPLHVPTKFGVMRCRVVELSGAKVAVIQRHSTGHKVPPHDVNYLALAAGAQQLGITTCLSSAAVGSLHEEWPVGTLAVCTDFLDFSGRTQTLHSCDVVHTDFTDPFPASRLLLTACKNLKVEAKESAVYACANGPRYETPEEIRRYATLGADVVGMTAATEAIALGEAGVAYGCLSVVTNFAAGLSATKLQHAEVTTAMESSGESVTDVLCEAARLAAGG